MRNFITRTLTAAVYVILLVGCTYYSPVTSFLFFGIVATACVMEFSSIVNRHAGASIVTPLNGISAFLLVASVWLHTIGSATATHMLALYGLVLIYLMVSELYRKNEDPLRNLSLTFFSQVYIAIPFSLLPLMSVNVDPTTNAPVYSWVLPLVLFIFIWINDTGAYLFGMSLRKIFTAKLFPRISPKKSWVGSIGGGLLTIAASVAASYLFPETLKLWQWIGFAAVVVLSGTWGDLVESLFKRHLDIKDSGNILPGHGGFLDRFDSALLAIPASLIYLYLIR